MFFIKFPSFFLVLTVCQSFCLLSTSSVFSSEIASSEDSRPSGTNRIGHVMMKMARDAFPQATDQADKDAQSALADSSYLGRGSPHNPEQAVVWTREAAEQGYALAQYCLGTAYKKGNGVEQNQGKAIEWYKKSAEQGDTRALSIMGNAYDCGWGVLKDYRRAFCCYKKAAEQGDARAQYRLGLAYEYRAADNGIDMAIEHDIRRAAFWWKKSKAQGYFPACCAYNQYRYLLDTGNTFDDYYM